MKQPTNGGKKSNTGILESGPSICLHMICLFINPRIMTTATEHRQQNKRQKGVIVLYLLGLVVATLQISYLNLTVNRPMNHIEEVKELLYMDVNPHTQPQPQQHNRNNTIVVSTDETRGGYNSVDGSDSHDSDSDGKMIVEENENIDHQPPATAGTISEKYLLYFSHSGSTNQLLGLQRATRIAMRTNRTLVLPPLLPHCTSRDNRGEYDDWDCETGLPNYADEVEGAKFHARLAADPDVAFPSWTEILDFDKLVDHDSGQPISFPYIDMPDFIRERANGNDVNMTISEFFSGNETQMQEIYSDYNKFTKVLEKPEFTQQDVVVMGSAFKNKKVTSRDQIPVGGYQFFPPSQKLVKVLRRIVPGVQDQADAIHCDPILPSDYIGAHLRIDDTDMITKSMECSSSHYKAAFDPVIKDIQKIIATTSAAVNDSDRTSKRTIYLGSSSITVRDCFQEALKHIQTPPEEGKGDIAFEVLMIQDILDRDSMIKDLIGEIHLVPKDILVVIDQIVISLAENIVMGKTLQKGSTFQNAIVARHNHRDTQLDMMALASI